MRVFVVTSSRRSFSGLSTRFLQETKCSYCSILSRNFEASGWRISAQFWKIGTFSLLKVSRTNLNTPSLCHYESTMSIIWGTIKKTLCHYDALLKMHYANYTLSDTIFQVLNWQKVKYYLNHFSNSLNSMFISFSLTLWV